jgi:germination protein M
MSWRRVVGALLCGLLVFAACGDEGAPGPGGAGPGATPTGEETPEPNPTSPTGTVTYQVWFYKGEVLTPAARTQESTPRVGTAALESLIAGPTEEEASRGLGTAIPAGTELLGLTVEDGVATADLTSAYESGGGSLSVRMRLAQVVFTLTQFPTVSGVAFELDGRPVSVFSGEGLILDEPLRRSDFEDLMPAITVEAPRPGAEVTSPVTISGTANVFEATVSLRLLDAEGREIARGFTTATCGTGCRGTYSKRMRFEIDGPQAGVVEAFEESAEDGSATNVVRVPVTLLP